MRAEMNHAPPDATEMPAKRQKSSSPRRSSVAEKEFGESEVKGLWAVAEHVLATDREDGVRRAVICLEAVLQISTHARLYEKFELETRVRLGDILTRGTQTVGRAKVHLERAVILIKDIPGSIDLKCKVYSLLVSLYLRMQLIPNAKLMVGSGIELAASEGRMPWVEHFQILRIHCLRAGGQLQDAAKELSEYASQAESRASWAVAILCRLVEVQLVVQEPGWDKSRVESMLSSCKQMFSNLDEGSHSSPAAPAFATAAAAIAATAAADMVSGLRFTFDALLVFNLLRDAQSQEAGEIWEKYADVQPVCWMPPKVIRAFVLLVSARIKISSDVTATKKDAEAGETSVDDWLRDCSMFVDNGEGVRPTVTIGCRTETADSALRLKSALAEVSFQASITGCDYVTAAAKLQTLKLVALTFPEVFPEDYGKHLAFLSAVYAYSTGNAADVPKWCDLAVAGGVTAIAGKDAATACQLLRAQAALETGCQSDCQEALERSQVEDRQQTAAVSRAACLARCCLFQTHTPFANRPIAAAPQSEHGSSR